MFPPFLLLPALPLSLHSPISQRPIIYIDTLTHLTSPHPRKFDHSVHHASRSLLLGTVHTLVSGSTYIGLSLPPSSHRTSPPHTLVFSILRITTHPPPSLLHLSTAEASARPPLTCTPSFNAHLSIIHLHRRLLITSTSLGNSPCSFFPLVVGPIIAIGHLCRHPGHARNIQETGHHHISTIQSSRPSTLRSFACVVLIVSTVILCSHGRDHSNTHARTHPSTHNIIFHPTIGISPNERGRQKRSFHDRIQTVNTGSSQRPISGTGERTAQTQTPRIQTLPSSSCHGSSGVSSARDSHLPPPRPCIFSWCPGSDPIDHQGTQRKSDSKRRAHERNPKHRKEGWPRKTPQDLLFDFDSSFDFDFFSFSPALHITSRGPLHSGGLRSFIHDGRTHDDYDRKAHCISHHKYPRRTGSASKDHPAPTGLQSASE